MLTDKAKSILTEVKARVLEEPGRLYMSSWNVPADQDEFDSNYSDVYRPPCNTVGCIAGNVIVVDMLRNGRKFNPGDDMLASAVVDELYDYSNYGSIARHILELDFKQNERLFYVGCWPAAFRAESDNEGPWSDDVQYGYMRSASWPVAGNFAPQTIEYAQVVANRIQHFIDTDGAE